MPKREPQNPQTEYRIRQIIMRLAAFQEAKRQLDEASSGLVQDIANSEARRVPGLWHEMCEMDKAVRAVPDVSEVLERVLISGLPPEPAKPGRRGKTG